MANGQISGPPAVDFYSMLSGLGDTIQKQRADEARKAAYAQALQPGPNGTVDFGRAALGLLPVDAQGASALSGMQNHRDALAHQTSQDAFQRDESARAQKNADRSYGLQVRSANRADEDKYSVQKFENPDGTTSFVKVNPRTGDVLPTGPIAPPTAAQGNPFAPQAGKFNGDQGKAAGFTDRMLQSEGILSGQAPDGGMGPPSPALDEQGTSYVQKAKSLIPSVGNSLVSKEYQRYNQARADFTNAQLRRESGAAIGRDEYINAEKQYFPVPGDSSEVIAQKRNNRRAAVEAMGREGGGAYRPKTNYNSNGVLQSLAAPQPAQQSMPRATNARGQSVVWNGTMWVPDSNGPAQ